MSTEPLLALVMIVKNEAKGIVETLSSARPFIDRYTILDTGSTDGTQALVRTTLAGLPGELVEEPFVDYGTTRSRVLELAGERSTFALMLSGDETLHDGQALRDFCVAHAASDGDEHGAYHVRMHWGPAAQFDLERLTRTRAGWRYVGATHEYLTKPGAPAASVRVPRAFIHHDTLNADPERKRLTWQKDRELLERELAAHPDDPRATFYLGQTLDDLGLHAEAAKRYERRVALGGWHEEVFEAAFRAARCSARANAPWIEVERAFLAAHQLSPQRAEPLVELAELHLGRNEPALAYLYGRRAQELPFPEDGLFIDSTVYSYRAHQVVGVAAYYLGEFTVGRRALLRALEALPGDERLRANLEFYERRLREPTTPAETSERAAEARLVLPLCIAETIESIPGWFAREETDLLVAATEQAVRELETGELVEVGSYCGRSTVAIASVLRALAPSMVVHAIDPHEGVVGDARAAEHTSPTLAAIRANVARAGVEPFVRIVRERSTDVQWSAPIRLLLVDGLHDYDSVSADFRHFERFVIPGGLVAFHDYTEGWPGVRRLVDEVLAEGSFELCCLAGSLMLVRRRA